MCLQRNIQQQKKASCKQKTLKIKHKYNIKSMCIHYIACYENETPKDVFFHSNYVSTWLECQMKNVSSFLRLKETFYFWYIFFY